MSSSENTISWSDIPGMVSSLVNIDGLLVITRSRVFSPRVGSSTILLGTDHLTWGGGWWLWGFIFCSELFFRTTRDCFFLHQNQNTFFSNIGNQNIFLEKKHTPPPSFQVKWSFPYE